MTQRTSVPSRPPSARVSSPVVASTVVSSTVALSTSSTTLPPDIVRLIEVLARIEVRRRQRLLELQGREAS